MLGDPILYWTLRSILLIILLFSGYLISYKDESGLNFWKYATPSIIAYSLIQGLRYMRGRDYYHYMEDLQGNLFTEYNDPLYLFWLDIFHASGLHFAYGFVFYSFLLIVTYLLIVKQFPKTAVWALPMFLILTPLAENLVRQYFATCFMLLAIYFFYKEKKKWMIASFIGCVTIHFSGYFPIILFLIFAYLNIEDRIKVKNPLILLAIYLLVYFFWDNTYFMPVVELLEKFQGGEDFAGSSYVENAERWFSEEGSISLVLGESKASVGIVLQSVRFLTNVALIWFGWYAMQEEKRLNIIYWFSYLAILIHQIGSDIEMYQRFHEWLVYLTPILFGGLFAYYKWNNSTIKYVLVAIFLINYLFYETIRSFGSMGYSGCAFIWDM